MLDPTAIALSIGVIANACLLAAVVWSIIYPGRRIWPPRRPSTRIQIAAWLLTLGVFGSALIAGVADWNSLQVPGALRWGLGASLIILGNLVVWLGVARLGMRATSGGTDTLVTTGLYRYSRNPQYLADIGILAGWAVLSASLVALPIVAGGILILLLVPLAEEPWLEDVYGDAFRSYCKTTPRYI